MPSSFTLKEPNRLSSIESPLGLNEAGFPMFECARILAGSVDIYRKSDERILKPRWCYLSHSNRSLKRSTIREIVSTLYGEPDVQVDAFARSLREYGPRNKSFWTEINAELCLVIDAIHSNRPVDSFLYTYRLHERVSVALPLIYAHSETDFNKALEFIKSVSAEDRDGELTIFKYFVSKYFSKNDLYRDLTIDIDFSVVSTGWASLVLQELRAALNLDTEKNSKKFRVDEQAYTISFDFVDFPIFLVSFRNRLFHYTNYQRNLDLDRIGGASQICQLIVPSMLYCLSQVVSEIIRRQVRG